MARCRRSCCRSATTTPGSWPARERDSIRTGRRRVPTDMRRAPAELTHAAELGRLAEADRESKPAGWRLSPRAVRSFIVGDAKCSIRRKLYGDDALSDRCIVTLMSDRGLMLVGEPRTAKSMLSDLLAAAIGGDSTCASPGTSG